MRQLIKVDMESPLSHEQPGHRRFSAGDTTRQSYLQHAAASNIKGCILSIDFYPHGMLPVDHIFLT
jgi:hypothetical protein